MLVLVIINVGVGESAPAAVARSRNVFYNISLWYHRVQRKSFARTCHGMCINAAPHRQPQKSAAALWSRAASAARLMLKSFLGVSLLSLIARKTSPELVNFTNLVDMYKISMLEISSDYKRNQQ